MLALDEIQEPHDELELVQPQVIAYWEGDCLGQGNLYVTIRMVTWISNRDRKGFRLPFPAISVHAASGSNDDFPEACLFLVIDVSKTEINYSHSDVVDEEEGDEDIINTAAIRFVPSDPSAIQHIFETMNMCQEKNPDGNDEMSSDEVDEECEMVSHDNGGDDVDGGSHQWFTADSRDGEVQLSAEGRANLERMLANLNDGSHLDGNTHDLGDLHISQHTGRNGEGGGLDDKAQDGGAMDED